MNLPWRGGFLLIALVFQDPTPPPPDLVARYAEILSKGPLDRRELAARALLTLGRPGYEAFKRAIVANPEVAKVVAIPGEPPQVALVRFPTTPEKDQVWKRLLAQRSGNFVVVRYPIEAEAVLWEALDSTDEIAESRARSGLRDLYSENPVDGDSPALMGELNRKRSFDVTDRSLPEILADEPISWILMAPRSHRTTLKLRNVTLRDFLRVAAPDLAIIPVNSLLILIPPDRVAYATPPTTVWASTDLAPRLESALNALARNETGPIKALTGVPVYNALLRALDLNPEAGRLSEELRKQLQQRVFFIGDRSDLKGPDVSLEPKGRKTSEVLADFERLTQRAIKVRSNDTLDQRAPDFRFKDIPAEQAARALEFRLNYLR